jgi:hypothetical protein
LQAAQRTVRPRTPITASFTWYCVAQFGQLRIMGEVR